MYKKSFLQPILLGLITILFASCDKDFNELGTDIIGDDHFGFAPNTDVTVKTYNQKLGPVASNNLPINPLGFYTNPAFGTTEANFVTQVDISSEDPTFNNTDPEDYDVNPTAIDSVILDIPYFSHVPKDATIVDNVKPYVLDSIYGPNTAANGVAISTFKLSVYQSNYYLRDLDPNQAFAETQAFYTDENNTIDNNKIPVLLNDSDNTAENSAFFFDKREHRLKTLDTDGDPVYTRSAPSMRLHLNKTIFANLILTAPEGKLDTHAIFKNYFRGIYFKVENGTPGNMAMINFKGGKITLYYNEDKKKSVNGTTEWERVNKSFVLNLTGNSVSLLKNNDNADYLTAANNTSEASKLYLKGGEGSIAIIDLFGSADSYKYKLLVDGNGDPLDENGIKIPLDENGDPRTGHFLTYEKVNTPNGVPDELDEIRYPAIDPLTTPYHSTKNRWMINEANLTFNIDKDNMDDLSTFEPSRIFLYDLTNKKVVVDYTYDFTTNVLFPKFNKGIFGGILFNAENKIFKQKNTDGYYVNKGTKYKIRITNYVRNLVKSDSTNVRLGLSVTENIANVGFSKLKTPNNNFKSVPTSSVMSPLGTILYGSGPDAPADKRLKLEIYYTKPD